MYKYAIIFIMFKVCENMQQKKKWYYLNENKPNRWQVCQPISFDLRKKHGKILSLVISYNTYNYISKIKSLYEVFSKFLFWTQIVICGIFATGKLVNLLIFLPEKWTTKKKNISVLTLKQIHMLSGLNGDNGTVWV